MAEAKKAKAEVKASAVTAKETKRMCRCGMITGAESVTATDGVTTITLPAGTVFTDGETYKVGLYLPIPVGTNGNQINVTNGSETYTVMNHKANYWRPFSALRQGMVLRITFFADPAHFLIVC